MSTTTLAADPDAAAAPATLAGMSPSTIPAEVLSELTSELGPLTLIRVNVNAVYASGDDLVVRVVRAGAAQDALAARQNALRGTDAPVVLPVNDTAIIVGDYRVDVYPRHRQATTDPGDVAAWGRATAELADVDVSGMGQSRVWRGGIAATIEKYLAELPAELPSEQREALLHRAEDALPLLAELTPARRGLVHGDSHLANVVIDSGGRGLWIDLDTLHVGNPVEDLSWVEVYLRRMVRDDQSLWWRFLAAYDAAGAPETDPDELAVLVYAREVEILLWTATQWNVRPELRSLLDDRLATLDRPEQPWVII